MAEINYIIDCLDWVFISVIVLTGRAVTNWFGKGTVLPKQHVILLYASVMACLFLLARWADGALYSKTWQCYILSYLVATSFYELMMKYIITFFESIFKKMKQ